MIRIIIVAVAVALGTAGITAALSQAGDSSPGPPVQLENGRLDDAMTGLDLDDDDSKAKDDESKDSKASKASVASRDSSSFKAAPAPKPAEKSTPAPAKSYDDSYSADSYSRSAASFSRSAASNSNSR